MPFFRKKPVIIEARLLEAGNPTSYWESVVWCKGEPVADGCIIHTLEGDLLANFGNWIIKGIQGEFYPCKPDIFEATYERVDSPDAESVQLLK